MQTVKYRSIYLLIAMAILIGLTFLVYQPGLYGPFVFDDAPNIVKNPGIAIQDLHFATLRQAAFSSASGPLSRPISMLTFALNHYANGYNNYYFKLINVLIHLLCGLGIFCVSASILRILQIRTCSSLSKQQQDLISIFVTTAWLLHPLCLTSILYVVQRMTSLSALFCIWGMAAYLYGRLKLLEGDSGKLLVIASVLIFTPLATLSKETGALLPLLLLVTELTLLNFDAKEQAGRKLLIALFTVCVAVPAAAAIAYSAFHPQWITATYLIRDFTLAERVMTESRVLCFYLKLILLPNISELGLYHDDIAYSHGLFDPVTTATSMAVIALLIFGAFVARKKAPVLSFGILFFFAGHILESTIFGLEIAHEHRNYLPMLGPIFAASYYLLLPQVHVSTLQIRRIIGLALIALFAVTTYSRSTDWANPFDLYTAEARHHPNSAQASLEMGTMYGSITTPDQEAMARNYATALSYYEKASSLNPNSSSGLVGMIKLSAIRNHPIEPQWVDQLRHRLQYSPLASSTADLLISLVTCRADKICKISNEQIEGLMQASLSNELTTQSNRASILSAYSYYLVNVAADYPKALQVMQETVRNNPGQLDYRMTLIKFCIASGHTQEAKEALVEMRKLDKLKKYATELDILSQKLATINNKI
ncbi:hypothetical protein [Undibacterium terreum]|uniref:hypothetical protein n=1 Tax=Undibacterium terreum TaxID=1224302 RepID=UPI001662DF89|nr:hypothetical protein [Undibacterium terreum]